MKKEINIFNETILSPLVFIDYSHIAQFTFPNDRHQLKRHVHDKKALAIYCQVIGVARVKVQT